MDVNDPNVHYVSPFLISNRTLAQTDDDTLALVLIHLANAVPDHSRSVRLWYEDIRNLNMLDLRPLLKSGEYDSVARTVLDRLCTSESLHNAKRT
jgi:hypothetical protein